MNRREFIGGLAGAVAWPLATRGQQAERMRPIGVLINNVANEPDSQLRIAAFVEELKQLGWNNGQNVHIHIRWSEGNRENIRRYAAELLALAPEVIVASTSPAVGALQEATTDVPIIFMQVADPVGAGFVDSLARPGRNTTGFTNFEYGISGKWLELLKELAPNIIRAAVILDPSIPSGIGQFGAIQSSAPSLGVEVNPVNVRDANEIERGLVAFARGSNSGLIVTSSALSYRHRELILSLAASHKLPAVYTDRVFVTSGGLISYGPARIEQYQRAADYVNRILKGEKPADMPVLSPTKYELVINLRTAKALGIEIPSTVLSRADEVIE